MLVRLFLMFLLLAPCVSPASAHSTEAGFVRRTTPDGIEVGIWYPATGTPVRQRLGLYAQDVVPDAVVPTGQHPLVVISHGTGGDFAGHVDTAVALARAGLVVAALTHPGDNWRDSSRATRIDERPAVLSAVISYMLDEWSGHHAIDPNRIGAFGFSAGGFTVLAAAGGRPDFSRQEAHCMAHPDFFDCGLLKSQPVRAAVPWPERKDIRLKAIVIAAPALGFTFDSAGLADVSIPVQLWRAGEDQILPAPFYADAVRAALPHPPEFRTVANAGHFDFLAPCSDPTSMPMLCQSAPGFDRIDFHAEFNDGVVRFFRATLTGPELDKPEPTSDPGPRSANDG